MSHFDLLGGGTNNTNYLVRYTYATNGLVLTATDANGKTSTNFYNTNGFLISTAVPDLNPPGYATNSFEVNELGWKLSRRDALGRTTRYVTIDLNGNVLDTLDPLPRHFYKVYDPNGNLTSAVDGNGHTNLYNYDAANQKVAVTNRLGDVWNYSYTSRGKLQTMTDPLTNIVTSAYDSANRFISVTDSVGSITNI